MNKHIDTTAQINDPRSYLSFQDILETVSHEPGQGRLLDQIEKIVRVQQRDRLDVILSQVAEDQLLPVQVLLERELPQRGKSNPAYNRFVIPSWKKHDDIYWQSLVDYIVLALRTFKEIDFCAKRGKLVLHYFDIPGGAARVQDVIRRLVWLIDSENLSVDFTRSRWMENWRHTVASMSREEVLTAAGILDFDHTNPWDGLHRAWLGRGYFRVDKGSGSCTLVKVSAAIAPMVARNISH